MRKHYIVPVWAILCLIALCGAGAAQERPSVAAAPGEQRPEKKSLCDQKTEQKVRSGVLNAGLLGVSGLYSVFDAETLYCKTYLLSPAFETFGRPGRVRVSQFQFAGAYGLTDRLEVFGHVAPFRHVNVGSPEQLSGSLLGAALNRATPQAGSVALIGNRVKGFYPLPGLNVSGALVGGVLPGLPVGERRLIADPVLMQTKAAFSTPAFLNDLPFLAGGGSASGDLTIGAKYRFSVVNQKNPASKFFSSSLLGYIKVPFHSSSGFVNSPTNDALTKGAGPGALDFGVFLVGSFYQPVAATDDASAPKASQASAPSYFETLNHHVNLGYIRRGDPSAGGARLVDRRDAFVFGYGLDTMLNRYAQAIGELRHERMLGGGTPNLIKHNPLNVTVGLRFYPGGLPEFREVKEGKVRSTRFWSVGFAYRLELGGTGGTASLGSSRHNFLVQFSFGRTKLFGGLGRDCPKELPCNDNERASLSGLRLENSTVRRGEVVTIIPQYRSGEFSKHDLDLYVDGQVVRNENLDSDGDRIPGPVKFTAHLRPRREPYRVKVRVRTTFEQTTLDRPECPQPSVSCEASEAEVELYVTNTAPTLTLAPPRLDRLSAQNAQTLTLTATAEDRDNDPLTLSWSAPAEIVLSGSDKDSVRSFSNAGLRPGGRYRVTVTASDGFEQVEQSAEITVNNPPVVELSADHPNLLGVTQGEELKLKAVGRDPDGDRLNYEWRLAGAPPGGQPLDRQLAPGDPSSPELTLSTQDLEPGKYTATVVASDAVDASAPARMEFEVVRRAPRLFFDFDKHLLRRSERIKLDEEAAWLSSDYNRTIEIRCEGNADLIGRRDYNFRLGCRRACAAKGYLISKGIDADRVAIAVSFGETNADQQRQKATDRRVDLSYARRAGELHSVPLGAGACDCPKVLKPKKASRVERRKR